MQLDKFGQMELTEKWHFELLNILEDMVSVEVDKDKTITAYMPEIIKVITNGNKPKAEGKRVSNRPTVG